MPDALLYPPSQNAVQTTLANQLLNSAGEGDTFTLSSGTGLQNKPGTCVINRIDANNALTPSSREYIEYSAISGTTVTIKTRNVDGSGASRTHGVGSIVEFIPDTTWGNRLSTALSTVVDTSDVSTIKSTIVTTTGTQSVSGAKTFTANLQFDDKVTFTDEVVDTIYDIGNSGTSKTIDWTNGKTQKMTLTGNCTLSFSNATAGGYLVLNIDVDGTGGYTLTLPANCIGVSGATITKTANAKNVIGFRYDGTNYRLVGVIANLATLTTL